MASALAAHKGHDARFQFVPFQIILLGPPLVPIWIAGLVSLWRRTATRAVAVAYPLMCALLLVIGGQPYYTEGLLLAFYAAGAVATCRWLAGRRGRRAWVSAGVGLNVVVSAVISLPLLPVSVLAKTPIPGINQTVRDQIGWPVYVRQVAAVYTSLPASDRADAVVIAGNYGETGAMVKYGRAAGLPAQIYSGQNALFYLAQPPVSATVAVVVGIDDDQFVASQFASCETRATLDDRVDIDNEEQGRAIRVCRESGTALAATVAAVPAPRLAGGRRRYRKCPPSAVRRSPSSADIPSPSHPASAKHRSVAVAIATPTLRSFAVRLCARGQKGCENHQRGRCARQPAALRCARR